MPKMKTNRGAAKRLKGTGGKRIKRSKAYARHLLSHKARGRKRRLRSPGSVDITQIREVRRLLPYIW